MDQVLLQHHLVYQILGVTTINDVVEDARRITNVCDLPLIVDIDTGFGGAFNISRSIRDFERAGVACVHIEDQISEKRCGHRPNKSIVSIDEMVDRIKIASSSKTDPDFQIMARTDALQNEGLDKAIERCKKYLDAGATMLFPEAFTKLEEYKLLSEEVGKDVPILANITEFGKTPLYTADELYNVGVKIILYPLSAHRAMCKASENCL